METYYIENLARSSQPLYDIKNLARISETLYDIKNLARSSQPFIKGYEDFIYLNHKKILGNGILIDNEGKLLWNVPWEHGYFTIIYFEKADILITDRVAMPGSCPMSLGICCISMKTGEYLWKHWYENSYDERKALRSSVPDINLVRGIGEVDYKEEYIFTCGFKIKIQDGSYEYVGQADENNCLKTYTNTIFQEEISSYICNTLDKSNTFIQFGITSDVISNLLIVKEGYFLNKYNTVIHKNKSLYFFVIPNEKNPKGALLFKYSKERKEIEEEIELPFRTAPLGVYNLFDKGIMVYEMSEGKEEIYNLWSINL